ncbi:MAG: hypothetical protein WAW37_15740 [Syntrophobacteraceae bacterium]
MNGTAGFVSFVLFVCFVVKESRSNHEGHEEHEEHKRQEALIACYFGTKHTAPAGATKDLAAASRSHTPS